MVSSNPQVLIYMGIKAMGSLKALAAALNVDQSTVRRWHRGQSGLSGTGLVALLALIRHPEDYERYKS